MNGPSVVAAGGVLWRSDASEPEVALVHRPKYDDWSLPKGKANVGEHLLVTALREVTEETGYNPRIGPYLATMKYRVGSGGQASSKVVTYWSMRCTGGSFQVNSEVDQMQWLPLAEAHSQLTSNVDRTVLDTFKRTGRDTEPLLLVRHGATEETSRRRKGQAEEQRLDRSGREQAASLVAVLKSIGVTDLLCADLPACVGMLEPFAATAGLTVRRESRLTLDGFAGNELDVADGVRRDAASGGVMVVCGGKKVVAGLLTALGHSASVNPPETPLKKGGLWLLHHRDGIVRAYERHETAS